MEKIPVFINNRNRLTFLKKLVDWLRLRCFSIVILDNNSDYPPLVDYYKTVDLEVVYLHENLGNTALYKWGGHLDSPGKYFIYTDSDVLPKEDCPVDLIDHLLFLKKKYQMCSKVGTSLETNDIPDFYPFKSEVLDWEAKFWSKDMGDHYVADVDTTFAIYDKSSSAGVSHEITGAIRTKRPYVVRHLPWYVDVKNLNEEERWYVKSADALLPNGKRVGMWTQKHKTFKSKLF